MNVAATRRMHARTCVACFLVVFSFISSDVTVSDCAVVCHFVSDHEYAEEAFVSTSCRPSVSSFCFLLISCMVGKQIMSFALMYFMLSRSLCSSVGMHHNRRECVKAAQDESV